MAMEKLILNSVMYGADKIPDSWFEKVPGGYFKEKKSQEENRRDRSGDDRRSGPTGGRRARTEDFHRDDDRRRSSGHRRRDRRSRSSYDGGADDEEYYYSGDERRHHRREKPHRRRRSVDDERRKRDDGYDDRSRRRDSKMNETPRGQDIYDDRDRPSTGGSGPPPPNPFSPNAYIPTVGVAGRDHSGGQSNAAPYPQTSNAPSPSYGSPRSGFQPPPQNRAAAGKVYIPYSNVYGDQTPPNSSNGQARPPRVDSTSPPVAPSPRGYQQNPFAQQAPTAVNAGAGAQYNGLPGFVNPAYNPHYSTRRNMRFDGAQDSSPPSDERRSRRDRSPSYSDDESRSDLRRTRSESRRKPKRGVGMAFDRSRRGLGYGATGAAAGGLMGSEFGAGAPAAVGAGIGGLGANAIQAKQQRKNERFDSEKNCDEQRTSKREKRRDRGYYSD